MTNDDRSVSDLLEGLGRTSWMTHASTQTEMHELWSELNKLRSSAKDDAAAYAALTVLCDVTSMMLQENSWNKPYSPMAQRGNERTFVAADAEPVELAFLEAIAPNIPNHQLRARVYDVLWLSTKDRAQRWRYGAAAVSAWADDTVDPETWFGESGLAWGRALEMAARLKLEADETRIESKLEAALSDSDSAVVVLRIAQQLRRLGYLRERATLVGAILTHRSTTTDDPFVERDLLLEAASWARRAGDDVEYANATLATAESWIREGDRRSSDSNLVAQDFYENALQLLRQIPRKMRSPRTLELLDSLPARVREAGLLGLDEMVAFETDPIDLSDGIAQVESLVADDDVVEALRKWFASLPLASLSDDRKLAEDVLAGSLLGLFGVGTLAGDGRKIHSSSADGEFVYGIPAGTWRQMIQTYSLRVQISVQGHIWPGHKVITTDHRLRLGDFLTIVRGSPFVSPDDEELFARALLHGYRGEFSAALFMLTPLLESLVRYALRSSGADTSQIDRAGAETEKGLSALMEMQEAETLFGADLTYELRALFCGPIGPNLRNNVAHGLVSAGEAAGIHGVYVWWFAFRLAFVPYLKALGRARERPAGTT